LRVRESAWRVSEVSVGVAEGEGVGVGVGVGVAPPPLSEVRKGAPGIVASGAVFPPPELQAIRKA
jgi:hypothetical protein